MRDKEVPQLINIHQEVRTLTPEWITSNTTLSTKAIEFLNRIDTYNKATDLVQYIRDKKKKPEPHELMGPDYLSKIELYRSCFPPGLLPSGSPARTSPKELTQRFMKFFEVFPNYNWDTIIAATERYVGEFAMNNYLYMKTASYFISKQDQDKNMVYSLASYCDMVLSGEPEETEYYTVEIK